MMPPPNTCEKKRILMIDDSPTILQILFQLLKDNNFQLIPATSGEIGLQLAKDFEPDLILLDIEMPEMNGFETCTRLKQDPNLRDTPVLFISSLEDVESKVRAFEAGGQDFISKPVQKQELLAHINTHLTLQTLQKNLIAEIEDKKGLIRILSHDISNPLTAIIGQAELLKLIHRQDETAIRERSGKIIAYAEHIRQIVDHVREMEAVKSGKKRLHLEPLPLKEMFKESMALFQDAIIRKNITLEISPPPEAITSWIWGDKISFISSIMGNILSNAIKFSYENSIISINISENENGEHVIVDVSDQGVGIPETILRNIFSTNAPTSRPGVQGERGTGFGMPIVKKYIELYGGAIAVSSRDKETYPNQSGSDIRLTLRKASISSIHRS